jgi:hypothetical protein
VNLERGLSMLAAVMAASGCSLMSMDSFEPWQPAANEFLLALPDDVLAEFTDEAHAVAYALATDCFADTEPLSAHDQAIADACVTDDWGRLSDIMTMDDLCTWTRFDGNVDVRRINGGALCG